LVTLWAITGCTVSKTCCPRRELMGGRVGVKRHEITVSKLVLRGKRTVTKKRLANPFFTRTGVFQIPKSHREKVRWGPAAGRYAEESQKKITIPQQRKAKKQQKGFAVRSKKAKHQRISQTAQ